VGQLFVMLDHYDQEKTPRMVDALRAELARYPGAELAVREFEQGPPIDAPLAMRITGASLDSLGLLATRVATELEQTPGTEYVPTPCGWRATCAWPWTAARLAAGCHRGGGPHRAPGLRACAPAHARGRWRRARRDAAAAPAARPVPEDLARLYVNGSRPDGPAGPGGEHAVRARGARISGATAAQYYRDRQRAHRATPTASRGQPSRVAALKLPRLRHRAAGEIESREESFGGIGAILVAIFGIWPSWCSSSARSGARSSWRR
jgi:hypothetical protein